MEEAADADMLVTINGRPVHYGYIGLNSAFLVAVLGLWPLVVFNVRRLRRNISRKKKRPNYTPFRASRVHWLHISAMSLLLTVLAADVSNVYFDWMFWVDMVVSALIAILAHNVAIYYLFSLIQTSYLAMATIRYPDWLDKLRHAWMAFSAIGGALMLAVHLSLQQARLRGLVFQFLGAQLLVLAPVIFLITLRVVRQVYAIIHSSGRSDSEMAENTRRFRYTGFITALLTLFFGAVIQWQFSEFSEFDKSVTYRDLGDFNRRHAVVLKFDWLQWLVLVAMLWLVRLFWIKEYNPAMSNKQWKAPVAPQPTSSPNERLVCRTDKFPADFTRTRTRTNTLEKFGPPPVREREEDGLFGRRGKRKPLSGGGNDDDGEKRGGRSRSPSPPPAAELGSASRTGSRTASSSPPDKALPPVPVSPQGGSRRKKRLAITKTRSHSKRSESQTVIVPIAVLHDTDFDGTLSRLASHIGGDFNSLDSEPNQGDVGMPESPSVHDMPPPERVGVASESPKKDKSSKRKSFNLKSAFAPANIEIPTEHKDGGGGAGGGSPFGHKTQPLRGSMASPGLNVASRVHVWESRDSPMVSLSRSRTAIQSARSKVTKVSRVSTAPQSPRIDTGRPHSQSKQTSSSTMGRATLAQVASYRQRMQLQQKSALTHMRHYSSSKSMSQSFSAAQLQGQGQGSAAKASKPPVPPRASKLRKSFRRPPVKPAKPQSVLTSPRSLRRQHVEAAAAASMANEAAAAVQRRGTRPRPSSIWDRPHAISISKRVSRESATREEDMPVTTSTLRSRTRTESSPLPPRVPRRPSRRSPPATPPLRGSPRTTPPLRGSPSRSLAGPSSPITGAQSPPRPVSLRKSRTVPPPKPPPFFPSASGSGASSLFSTPLHTASPSLVIEHLARVETFSELVNGDQLQRQQDDVSESDAAKRSTRGSEGSPFSGAITISSRS